MDFRETSLNNYGEFVYIEFELLLFKLNYPNFELGIYIFGVAIVMEIQC